MRRGAIALAAVALVSVVLAACGGSAASVSPKASAEVTLAPGSVRSSSFRPAVTLTVPAGWVLATDSADYFQLRPADQDVVGVHLFHGVAAASQDAACPTAAQPGIGTSSVALLAWIRSLKGLTVGSPRIETVGGLRGTSVDVSIAPGWTTACPFANGIPSVPLFVGTASGLRWVIAGGERLRLYLLDLADGSTLIADIDDFEGSQFASFLGVAEPIVRSLRVAAAS